jgi:transcriptional regulator with XRE-family HTH domain
MQTRRHLLIKFGAMVRLRRYAIGLTQLKLAEMVGCSLQAIGNLERGVANPSLIMIYRIAEALNIPPRDLIP